MNELQLLNTNLFKGMTKEEMHSALSYLHAYQKSYEKDEIILRSNTISNHIGLLLEGNLNIEYIDYQGNRVIMGHTKTGFIFGEAYALTGTRLYVDAIATSKCTILFLDVSHILLDTSHQENWYFILLKNLLRISSKKNLNLSSRNIHTSSKSIRGRVISYLVDRKLQVHTSEFNIPYDRQALADYLSVDRSALSAELSRMKKEGLIQYHKNHFKLLKEFDV